MMILFPIFKLKLNVCKLGFLILKMYCITQLFLMHTARFNASENKFIVLLPKIELPRHAKKV